jgi:hypothetical protein
MVPDISLLNLNPVDEKAWVTYLFEQMDGEIMGKGNTLILRS